MKDFFFTFKIISPLNSKFYSWIPRGSTDHKLRTPVLWRMRRHRNDEVTVNHFPEFTNNKSS